MQRVAERLTTILAVASALTALPLPASAATGTFRYCHGDGCRELVDPASDTCVQLEVEGYHGHNGTQSMGYLFHDAECTVELGNVDPGDDWRRLEAVNGVAFVEGPS